VSPLSLIGQLCLLMKKLKHCWVVLEKDMVSKFNRPIRFSCGKIKALLGSVRKEMLLKLKLSTCFALGIRSRKDTVEQCYEKIFIDIV